MNAPVLDLRKRGAKLHELVLDEERHKPPTDAEDFAI